jgi:hypothetical protein
MAPPGPPSPTSPEVVAGAEESASMVSSSSMSPVLLPSGAQSAQYSPAFSPRNPGHPQRQPSLEFSTTILPSPALGPTYVPETVHSPHFTWQASAQPVSASTSPAMLPQQRNSISSYGADTDIDHEASAALLMLNMDRRGTMDSVKDVPTAPTQAVPDKRRKMGMSVRDLLVS